MKPATLIIVFFCLLIRLLPSHGAAAAEPVFFGKGFLAMPSLSLAVEDRQGELIRFDPNRFWSAGAGASYGNLAAAISLPVGDPVDDTARDGETSHFDLQVQWYEQHLGVEFLLQSYEGYFVRDLPAGCRRGEPCSLRPDRRVGHLGVVGYYILDPRWSMRAAFNPPEHQAESSGSWFMNAGINYYDVAADGALIDDSTPAIADGRFYLASLAPGYGATWKWGNWFLAGAAYFGGGVMFADPAGAERQSDGWGWAVKAGLKCGAGYAGRRWLAGFRALADASFVPLAETEYHWLAQSVEIYLGRSF